MFRKSSFNLILHLDYPNYWGQGPRPLHHFFVLKGEESRSFDSIYIVKVEEEEMNNLEGPSHKHSREEGEAEKDESQIKSGCGKGVLLHLLW